MSDERRNERPETPKETPLRPGDGVGPQFERDEIHGGLLTVVGAFVAVVVFLIVVLLQAWFYNWKTGLTASRALPATDPQTALGRTLIEQQSQINSYHWINRDANLRAIPIERAMELTVREMSATQKSSKKPVEKGHAP